MDTKLHISVQLTIHGGLLGERLTSSPSQPSLKILAQRGVNLTAGDLDTLSAPHWEKKREDKEGRIDYLANPSISLLSDCTYT